MFPSSDNVFLSLAIVVLAHDAGHTGITGQAGKDRLIGTVVANWVGGLSLSWWKDVSFCGT